MSSDYLINEKELIKSGVTYTTGWDDTYGSGDIVHYASFPGYDYLREIDVIPENAPNSIHISCGGSFRSWLEDYLTINQISFTKD